MSANSAKRISPEYPVVRPEWRGLHQESDAMPKYRQFAAHVLVLKHFENQSVTGS
jgi:hypothetical protein